MLQGKKEYREKYRHCCEGALLNLEVREGLSVKRHVTRSLKKARERAFQISWGGAFYVKITLNAKALQWGRAWCIPRSSRSASVIGGPTIGP